MTDSPASAWAALGRLRYGIVAVGTVIVLMVVGVVVGSTAEPGSVQDSQGGGADAVRAAGFAEEVVGVFLRAGEDRAAGLGAVLAEPVELSGVASGYVWPLRTSAVEVEQVGEGYWSVLVTVDALELGNAGEWSAVAESLAYRVGVGVTGDGAVATGLPSRVASPGRVAAPELTVSDVGDVDGTDPVVAAAVTWLTGELTAQATGGEGEAALVEGWTPFAAAPFVDVSVVRAGTAPTDDVTVVRLVGTGTTADDRREAFEYSVAVSYDALYATHRVVGVFPAPPGPGYVVAPAVAANQAEVSANASGPDGGSQRSVWGVVLVVLVVAGSAWWIARRVQVGTTPQLPVIAAPTGELDS